jgi:phosphohistidine phosphatase SixA
VDTSDQLAAEPVRFVLVRHAERLDHGAQPLTTAGRSEAGSLGDWLASAPAYTPGAILCSRVSHAREHAGITWGRLRNAIPIMPVTALTPNTAETEFSVSAMRLEAAALVDWARVRTVVCIGHEPRLSQLAEMMTGQPTIRLDKGQLQVVEADSWGALDAGRGRLLGWRHHPLPDLQASEPDLLPKIRSKVETSTLLAGFTFAVLVVLLTEPEYWAKLLPGQGWPSGLDGWRAAGIAAALFCLTLAALLFVVSVYMYDRLSMPQRYWDDPGRPGGPRQSRWPGFQKDHDQHGLLFAYMIWIWRFVFSAGVLAVLLGFFILVLHRGVWLIAALCLAAIVAAITFYTLFRPDLGVD